ncbi:MAG TPA: ABC transporter permease [Anaerolineae bacterium]|nr:ABC transporter permease [Anaerolineae bacterium]
MIEILRNMLRHKVRTSLTIFGIVIGIFALTVMGSMAEYFNTMLDNAIEHAGSTISVRAKGGFSGVLNESIARRIKRVRGVREVIPSVADSLEEMGGVQMGMPDMVVGLPPELARLSFSTVTLAKGRWLQRGDTYHAVIGSKIAAKKSLSLGDELEWREEAFTVVGIMAETGTFPDQYVVVPLDIARRTLEQPRLIMGLNVVPSDPAQVEAVAALIVQEVPDVRVQSPQKAIDEVRQSLMIFNVIMLSGAMLAVIVGGLAVINTMVMSVTERTREIGVKKAVGADDLDIVLEYVTEAGVMGLIGGVTGLALGTGMAHLLNTTAAQYLGGSEIFTVTPRLAIIALLFAVGLGALGGLYPAWRAARLDPVQALRTE